MCILSKPGLFRSALVEAVEALVDQKLNEWSLSIQAHLDSNQGPHMLGFYCKWDASDLDELEVTSHNDNDDGLVQERRDSSSLNNLSVFSPTSIAPAPNAPAIPRGKLTRLPSRVEANSRVFLSTRSLLPVPKTNVQHSSDKKKKQKASKKKRKKNAVIDHVAPRILHRATNSKSSPSDNLSCRERIATLFTSMMGVLEESNGNHEDPVENMSSIRLLTWKSPPLSIGSAGSDNTLVVFHKSHSYFYCLVPTICAAVVASNFTLHQKCERDLHELERLASIALSG